MPSFTPGPLKILGTNVKTEIRGFTVIGTQDLVSTAYCAHKSDAVLYATAPTMYEALIDARLQIQYLHDKFQSTGSGVAVLSRIDAALAKAEGRNA